MQQQQQQKQHQQHTSSRSSRSSSHGNRCSSDASTLPSDDVKRNQYVCISTDPTADCPHFLGDHAPSPPPPPPPPPSINHPLTPLPHNNRQGSFSGRAPPHHWRTIFPNCPLTFSQQRPMSWQRGTEHQTPALLRGVGVEGY